MEEQNNNGFYDEILESLERITDRYPDCSIIFGGVAPDSDKMIVYLHGDECIPIADNLQNEGDASNVFKAAMLQRILEN